MKQFLIVLLICFPVIARSYDLKEIRMEFYQAVNNEKASDNFYKKLKAENLKDPLLLAYYGSAEALRAKHVWNPYNKVSFLKSGLRNLEKAIRLRPESLEIRFLRFSLQHYLPAMLGMSRELDADRRQIVKLVEQKQLGTVDAALLKNIVSFMKESGRCSAAEIAILDKAV